MKKIKSKDNREFFIDVKKSGENQMLCPICSHTRKKKNDKCLSWNEDKGVGQCFNCNMGFYKPSDTPVVKNYDKPKFENYTELTTQALNYFQDKRAIGQKTLVDMGIVSKEVFMPQTGKKQSSICFPYYRNGELVNVKYLSYYKSNGERRRAMKMEKNAELVWYNYDAIINNTELIIVEGEIDALSFISQGIKNVVSVPNGANIGQMSYLDSSMDILETIDTFYIAVDNDDAGIKLQKELVRRLGEERCRVVQWGDVKDANDYHIKHKMTDLDKVLEQSKVIRPDGIEVVDDMWDSFLDDYYSDKNSGVGINLGLDEFIKFETGRFMIITGTPSSGKSNFCHFLNSRLNTLYGWKVAYWSSEKANNELLATIGHILLGDGRKLLKSDLNSLKSNLNDNYFFVDANSIYKIEEILDKMRYFVKMYGVKIINIDPFTNIERSNDNDYTYIRETLNKLVRFAKRYDVLVQLVAHPKKLTKGDNGILPIPSMYDISGSADFWNKCDYGIAVARNFDVETQQRLSSGVVQVHKVKTTQLGREGLWEYDYSDYRYFNRFGLRDNDAWVNYKVQQEEFNYEGIYEINEEPF